jgi:hypothetical protein
MSKSRSVFVQPKYANLLNRDVLDAAAGIRRDDIAVVPSSSKDTETIKS